MDHREGEFAARLVASLRSGLVAVDAAGRLRCANLPARRALALPEADASGDSLLGRPCEEVFAGRPALSELLLGALSGREPPSRAELHLDAAGDAPPATIGFTVTTVRGEGDEPIGAALSFRDLLPLERLDERERLRERLVALGEMAAGLAHEIRNPLASLGVAAGLLKRRVSAVGEARELVDELLGEIRTLQATVSAALDFVKPVPPASGAADLVAALEEALARSEDALAWPGAVERRFCAPAPQVAVDAEPLRSVLLNLVANAMQATRSRGAEARLSLRLAVGPVPADAAVLRVRGSDPVPRLRGQEAVLEVADNGPGVPEPLRERIFYPFFTTRESGSGIGLAVAQKVVAGHGGALELVSPPEGGATFRVRLPLAEEGTR